MWYSRELGAAICSCFVTNGIEGWVKVLKFIISILVQDIKACTDIELGGTIELNPFKVTEKLSFLLSFRLLSDTLHRCTLCVPLPPITNTDYRTTLPKYMGQGLDGICETKVTRELASMKVLSRHLQLSPIPAAKVESSVQHQTGLNLFQTYIYFLNQFSKVRPASVTKLNQVIEIAAANVEDTGATAFVA
ncbi:hypothetical protein CSKR_104264 [Clonorchis sinensis]|uniref:Uncharacterized protein n=1 Tax=Clonorchis sinensis TaxID=79923 RepID=A0A419QCY8_CLOSI|nr:hypothetical protein CSKR_104264 [Clonorchis sinensis]